MVARPAIGRIGLLLAWLSSCGPIAAQDRKPAETPARADARPSGAKEKDRAAEAVARLVEPLRRHPARPSADADRLALHLIDVETGEVTLIADEPDAGLVRIGSTSWSHDGRRILFDAMPMNQPAAAHLKVIELEGDRVAINDLGPGNCPTFSPDDGRIAFLSNVAPQTGVWLMRADGSTRTVLGSYGRPLWSPDSRQLMIVNFNLPRLVTMMNVEPDEERHRADRRQGHLPGAVLGRRGDDRGGHRLRLRRHHRAGQRATAEDIPDPAGLVAEERRAGRQAVLPVVFPPHRALRLRGHRAEGHGAVFLSARPAGTYLAAWSRRASTS